MTLPKNPRKRGKKEKKKVTQSHRMVLRITVRTYAERQENRQAERYQA